VYSPAASASERRSFSPRFDEEWFPQAERSEAEETGRLKVV
jgi:hypothetical protein